MLEYILTLKRCSRANNHAKYMCDNKIGIVACCCCGCCWLLVAFRVAMQSSSALIYPTVKLNEINWVEVKWHFYFCCPHDCLHTIYTQNGRFASAFVVCLISTAAAAVAAFLSRKWMFAVIVVFVIYYLFIFFSLFISVNFSCIYIFLRFLYIHSVELANHGLISLIWVCVCLWDVCAEL